MHHGTPFFQGFSSILFGRPALSGLQQKLRDVAALNTLSDFFATFGFLIPDALLRRRSTGMNSRQRRFTLHVTFWAFLAQTLVPETSCRDIVRKVQAWWLLRAPKSAAGSSSTAAYTKARQRLDPKSIQGIGQHLVERLEGRVQPSQLWRGRRVRVVDGTTVSMPDTPKNQAKYPQPSSQKAGCGFPQMRIVGLFSLASGALLDFAKSSIHVHESILFRQLISTLKNFQRWSVELHFREIKITLGMDVLRCQTPGMVEKEVMMHAISYNLIRALMQEAAIRHQVDLTRISFKGTVDTLRHWSASLEALRGMPRKQQALLEAMFELIAKDLVPLRPGREEPRAKKRRPKNYQLLTKPRKEMKTPGHRNRPKSTLS